MGCEYGFALLVEAAVSGPNVFEGLKLVEMNGAPNIIQLLAGIKKTGFWAVGTVS